MVPRRHGGEYIDRESEREGKKRKRVKEGKSERERKSEGLREESEKTNASESVARRKKWIDSQSEKSSEKRSDSYIERDRAKTSQTKNKST